MGLAEKFGMRPGLETQLARLRNNLYKDSRHLDRTSAAAQSLQDKLLVLDGMRRLTGKRIDDNGFEISCVFGLLQHGLRRRKAAITPDVITVRATNPVRKGWEMPLSDATSLALAGSIPSADLVYLVNGEPVFHLPTIPGQPYGEQLLELIKAYSKPNSGYSPKHTLMALDYLSKLAKDNCDYDYSLYLKKTPGKVNKIITSKPTLKLWFK